MTSSRPYLLRAIYDWLADNELTAYLLVNAEADNVMVPTEHVQEGKIILNISPSAVQDLHLENDSVSFSARFSGKAMQVYIPMQAVMALYSMENGKGMMFPEEEDSEASESDENLGQNPELEESENQPAKDKKKAPFLKVVK